MAYRSLYGPMLGVDPTNADIMGKGELPVARAPDNRVVAVTTTTVTITRASHDLKTILLNRAAGITATLPAPTGSGAKYRFVIPTSLSGTTKIKVPTTTDRITGRIMVDASLASNAPTGFSAGSTADTISLNGTTTGGKKGDCIEIEDVGTNLYLATGMIQSTGVSATPFVVSV